MNAARVGTGMPFTFVHLIGVSRTLAASPVVATLLLVTDSVFSLSPLEKPLIPASSNS
jgi:hypothetical protein